MIIEKIGRFILRHRLITAGQNILAACSGGPDSLALVDVLRKMRQEFGFQLAVAHVDHMFRGEESAADAEFVREYCRRNGLACYSTAINVPAYLSTEGGSAEDVSRRLRYHFLRETAKAWGGAKIATGHHRDDQAETVLLHLFRGSGGSGLRGMQPETDGIIRPFLAVTRQEIADYCHQEGLSPRLDSTNLEPDYLRNRIRLRILPVIENELGGGVREPLCRFAEIIAGEQDFLQEFVGDCWPKLALETPAAVYIYTEPLLKHHIALKRLVFRRALEKKLGTLTGITFQHVEKLIEMAELWSVGSKIDLPNGWMAEREYDSVKICRRSEESSCPGIAAPGIALKIPGEITIRELGVQVKAMVHFALPQSLGPDTAVFDLEHLEQPLFVRSRQPGDRFFPRGMQGEKKLKDFFIDKKIPSRLRDQVPVFCDNRNSIFWLGGLRGSRQGQITAETTKYLTLQIVRIQEDDT